MKNRRKLLLLLFSVVLVLALVACTPQNPVQNGEEQQGQQEGQPEEQAVPIHIGIIMGPTGMGMAKLMEDAPAGYQFQLASAPDDIASSFGAGEYDIAAVPVNLAAALYQRTEGDTVVIALNTLGVLYILEDGDTVQSLADLAGKTLYATGQGSTPEYILNYVLAQNGLADTVTVEYKTENSELATLLAAGEIDLAMLPEPNVTATMLKKADLRVALDLTAEWDKVSDAELVQGCLIASRQFVEENPEALEAFLTQYAASVNYANENPEEAGQLIEKHGIMASAAAAAKAIPNCNLVTVVGADMKASMQAMLDVLYNANPKSVGGALPGDDFYYEK